MRKSKIWKITSILFAATLIAGLAVATSYAVMEDDDAAWIEAAKPYAGVTIYGMATPSSFSDMHIEQGKRFEKLTGIKVVIDQIPSESFYAKQRVDLISRSGTTDFSTIDFGDLTPFVKMGVVEPLNEILDDPDFPVIDWTDYPQSIMDLAVTIDGLIYGFPADGAVMIQFYRKDLFEKAGVEPATTWEEVLTVARKMKPYVEYGNATEMKTYYPVSRGTNILPYGTNWLDENHRASVLRDPRTIANYEIWNSLWEEGFLPPGQPSFSREEMLTFYRQGKVGMLTMAWPGYVGENEDPTISGVAGKTGYVPVPGKAPYLSGWTYSVHTDSKNKEATTLFLSWLTNEKQSYEALTKGGMWRFRESLLNDNAKQAILKTLNGASKWEALEAMRESGPGARMTPLIDDFNEVRVALSPFLIEAIIGKRPVKEALAAGADRVEEILAGHGYYD